MRILTTLVVRLLILVSVSVVFKLITHPEGKTPFGGRIKEVVLEQRKENFNTPNWIVTLVKLKDKI